MVLDSKDIEGLGSRDVRGEDENSRAGVGQGESENPRGGVGHGQGESENQRGRAKKHVNRLIQKFDKSARYL